jgi:hypothetical protein
MFESRELRGMLRCKKLEITRNGENCILKSFNVCTPHQI